MTNAELRAALDRDGYGFVAVPKSDLRRLLDESDAARAARVPAK